MQQCSNTVSTHETRPSILYRRYLSPKSNLDVTHRRGSITEPEQTGPGQTSLLTQLCFVLSSLQVIKLQAKWIGQVLFRIASMKGDLAPTQDAFKAFIPRSVTKHVIKTEVLSFPLARAMQCLQDLCHMDDMADLRACVDTIGDVLSNSEFVECYKPLARLTTMTQFKKLMLAAHSQLSAWEMDRQVGDQVEDVKATLMALRTSLSQVKSDKVQLQDILRILKDAVGGKSKASQLPQTEKSCHFAFSRESMTAIDEDRIPFHVNFSE